MAVKLVSRYRLPLALGLLALTAALQVLLTGPHLLPDTQVQKDKFSESRF